MRLAVIKEGETRQHEEDNQTTTCKVRCNPIIAEVLCEKLLISVKADFILRERHFLCMSQGYLDQYLCQKRFFVPWQTLSTALYFNV